MTLSEEEYFIGNQVVPTGLLRCVPVQNIVPIENGIIKDWDAIEQIWGYTFRDALHVDPEQCSVLVPGHPYSLQETQKTSTAEILFETFNVAKFASVLQPVLALHASGKTTGCVVQSGLDATYTVPVVDGCALSFATRRLHLGGSVGGTQVTQRLMRLFQWTANDFELANDIKHRFCSVAPDAGVQQDQEFKSEQRFELPDGKCITVGKERFLACEILFHPRSGLHRLLCDTVNHCAVEDRGELFSNIVLSGGNSMLAGFGERLEREIKKAMDDRTFLVDSFARSYAGEIARMSEDIIGLFKCFTSYQFGVSSPPNRKYAVWIGGSMMASLSSFDEQWIAREGYDEYGINRSMIVRSET